MLFSVYLTVLEDKSDEEQFIDAYNTYKRLVYHTAYEIMNKGMITEYPFFMPMLMSMIRTSFIMWTVP